MTPGANFTNRLKLSFVLDLSPKTDLSLFVKSAPGQTHGLNFTKFQMSTTKRFRGFGKYLPKTVVMATLASTLWVFNRPNAMMDFDQIFRIFLPEKDVELIYFSDI